MLHDCTRVTAVLFFCACFTRPNGGFGTSLSREPQHLKTYKVKKKMFLKDDVGEGYQCTRMMIKS